VAEVVQNAERLNGRTIRVRGVANVWVKPPQAEMWRTGGCVPKTDPSYRQGYVEGWLTLHDSIDPQAEDLWVYGGPRDRIGIKISETNFDCKGDYCGMTCSPFEVVSLRTYEFVGTLRVRGDELILENIDLEQSSQLVDSEWTAIPKRDFPVFFP
jgi:hypothetical protein